jgi:hypothetical protein
MSDLQLRHALPCVALRVEVKPADGSGVQVREQEVAVVVRVLEAGDDGIAKGATIGQCRDGETSGLPHPQAHLLPLLSATERLCEPGGVHAQAGRQAAKLRHFGSREQSLVV